MFFEVGSYKVCSIVDLFPTVIKGSAQPQFGEVEIRSSPDAQLCTAVEHGVQQRCKVV